MKRLFTLLVLLLALCVSSCSYDDSAIWNKYNNLEERVTALEKLCGEMNTNIEALETLIEALNEGTTISDVSEIKMDGKVIGYTISFSDDKEITIYHGKDGKDADNISGAIPEIGIAKDTDDIYYWTINGEWLLDKDGNKVSAQDCTGADGKDGITPRLKIEDGYWYVSYDGGDTWEEIGRATAEVDGDNGNGGCLFESVTYDNDYVYFTLSDGTTLALPRKKGSAVASERNKIYYTTTDGKKLFPQHSEPKYFGAIIVSNIYKDGIGVITFDDEVTLIGEAAFNGCISLTSITIPDSVTAIGDHAFQVCSSLQSVTIGNSATEIGSWAFCGCSSLTEFKGKFASEDGRCLIIDGTLNSFAPAGVTEYTIPDSVTAIGESAFSGCSNLTSVTIGNSVTAIGEEAFYECSSLTSITIPDSVTEIGAYAFEDCSSLESVYCKPTTPPSIGNWVFDGNASGCKIYVPAESVAAYQTSDGWSDYADSIIGYNFETGEVIKPTTPYNNQIWYTTTDGMELNPYNTTVFGANLVDNTYVDGKGVLRFDGDVTTIGEEAFKDCSSLTSITIPDSVTEIGDSAFWWCSSLQSVTIGNSVTAIGDFAFYGCRRLTSITIPDSVTAIGWEAFSGCSSLTSVTIPDSVTTIGGRAFNGCTNLSSLDLGNGVESIGFAAFAGCYNLESVTIPDSVTEIGESAFCGYDSLTEFKGKFASEDGRCLIIDGTLNSFAPAGVTEYTIPDSVTEIGAWAFSGCSSLTSVTIPDSVTTIGEYAFDSCSSLTSITIPDSVTAIGESVFRWCSSLTSVTIPNSVTTIGYRAFYDCSSLTSINIPDSVTEIGEEAFYECRSLTSVTIGNSVTTIREYAFYKCSSLQSVTIGNSVTTIGESAFSSCSRLKSVTIGNSVTTIGDYAFYECRSLTSINIPDRVTTIGYGAFAYCSSMTSVTIPDSVTTIGYGAFYECSSLTSITIPNSVTTIGEIAFYGCSNLESVYCKPTTPPSIGNSVFDSNASGRKIYVPAESVAAYTTASYWSDYASSIVGYEF